MYLGQALTSSDFLIETKAEMGLKPGGSTKDGIIAGWKQSQEALKMEKVFSAIFHLLVLYQYRD